MEPTKGSRFKIPPKVGDKTTAAEIQTFLDAVLDHASSKRHELVEDWLLANAYVSGHQWVKLEKERTGETRRTPRLVVESREDIPMPVLNVTMKVHDNEVARLSKRNSKFTVEAQDVSDPAAKAAARVAMNILQHHLKEIKWKFVNREFWDQIVRYGISPIISRGGFDRLDTVKTPVLNALRCKGKPRSALLLHCAD